MTTSLKITRVQLLERLKESLPSVEKEDARMAKLMQTQRVEHLRAFRVALKEAAKWDYETASKNRWDVFQPAKAEGRGYLPVGDPPLAPKVREAIKMATLDGRAWYTLSSTGPYRDLYRMATWSPPESSP